MTKPKPDLAHMFGLPPAEAISYLKGKGYTFSWDWQDVWQEAHTKAFTVAKAMRLDVLQDIHGELIKAMEAGTTLRDFQKSLQPTLEAKGWWGRQLVGDGQGGAESVQLGSPRRLRTIFETNMQTAFEAGNYKQNMENASDRPYWMYSAVGDKRTRPAHAALNGLVFRFDDPFWQTHHPPNGFRCRCSVRALDGDGYQAKLKSGEVALRSTTGQSPTATLRDEDRLVSKKTGVMEPVTVLKTTDLQGGKLTMAPDVGWNYNPGRASLWHQPPKTVKVVTGQKTWEQLGRPDLRRAPASLRTPSPDLLATGKDQAEAVDILARALGIQAGEQSALIATADGEKLLAHRERLLHMVEKRTDARERYGKHVLATLKDPFEIWLTEYEDGFRKQYIGLFTGKYDLQVVVREEKDGTILWNFMHADDRRMNNHRVGTLLHKKEE